MTFCLCIDNARGSTGTWRGLEVWWDLQGSHCLFIMVYGGINWYIGAWSLSVQQ